MKTTIDIPEALYKRAKILAVERGQSLKDVVVASLERELGAAAVVAEPPVPYWGRRRVLPEFQRLSESGALARAPGERSIDEILEEVRADTGS